MAWDLPWLRLMGAGGVVGVAAAAATGDDATAARAADDEVCGGAATVSVGGTRRPRRGGCRIDVGDHRDGGGLSSSNKFCTNHDVDEVCAASYGNKKHKVVWANSAALAVVPV